MTTRLKLKRWFIKHFCGTDLRFEIYNWMYNYLKNQPDDFYSIGFCYSLTQYNRQATEENKNIYFFLSQLPELIQLEPYHRGNAFWFAQTPVGRAQRLNILKTIIDKMS